MRNRPAWMMNALLATCWACTVGEPLIDRVPPVAEKSESSCMTATDRCYAEYSIRNTMPAALALAASSCESGSLDPALDEGDAAPSCDQPPAGGDWRDRDVLLRAEDPIEVVIAGGVAVRNVRITIDGPVTLLVHDVSTLEQVQIASASPEAEIVLDQVVAEQLIIGDAAQPFAGQLYAKQARIHRLSMVGASLDLDATMIVDSFLSVDALNSADGFLLDVVVEVGDALFAPSRLETVHFARCGSLSFFGGTQNGTTVPRCSNAPTRYYNVTVMNGVVDGAVHGDSGRFLAVQLGRFERSDYQLWGVALSGVLFCDGAKSLRSTYGITGSGCTGAAFGEPDDVCNLWDTDDRENENCCAALALDTPCPEPVPDRMRTVPDYWISTRAFR